MNRLREIRERLAALAREAMGLVERSKAGTFSDEDQARWDAVNTEVEQLKAEKATLEAREQQASAFEALNREYNQPASGSVARAIGSDQQQAQAAGRDTQSGRAEYQSLGRRVTHEDVVHRYREHGLATVDLGSFYHLSADDPQRIRAGSRAMETHALVYTGGLPATAVEPQRIPGILTQQTIRPTVRDAFLNSPTTSNLITFVREDVTGHTNAATFIAEPSASGGSTGLKPESTLVFDDDEAPVREIATHIPMSENIIDDIPGLQSLVENRLMDFLAQAEDDALLNGDGVTPNLLGIRNVSGIQVADAAYFAANPVQDDGESNEDFNRILAAAQLVYYIGLANTTFVMISPVAWQYLLTVTDAQRNYLGGGPFVTGALPRIWGYPVIVTNKLDDEIAIVGDGRAAEVRDRMQGTIDLGWVNDQFIRDMKTVRAKERLALPVYRPAGIVEVTLALN